MNSVQKIVSDSNVKLADAVEAWTAAYNARNEAEAVWMQFKTRSNGYRTARANYWRADSALQQARADLLDVLGGAA